MGKCAVLICGHLSLKVTNLKIDFFFCRFMDGDNNGDIKSCGGLMGNQPNS